MRVIAGKGMMDRNAPAAVLDTPHQMHSHLRGALNAGATTTQVSAALGAVKPLMTQEQWVKAETLWQELRERANRDADCPRHSERRRRPRRVGWRFLSQFQVRA